MMTMMMMVWAWMRDRPEKVSTTNSRMECWIRMRVRRVVALVLVMSSKSRLYFDTRCAFSVAHQTHKQLECRSGTRARVNTGKNMSWIAPVMQYWTYSRLRSRIAEEANNCVGEFRDVR